MNVSRCLIVLSLFTMVFGANACRSAEEGKLAEKQAIYLNQSLLKEAVPGMARIWKTSIELDPEVASLRDLWVDYSPGNEVSLRVALDEILHSIETQHGVRLRWIERDNHITIERQSEQ